LLLINTEIFFPGLHSVGQPPTDPDLQILYQIYLRIQE